MAPRLSPTPISSPGHNDDRSARAVYWRRSLSRDLREHRAVRICHHAAEAESETVGVDSFLRFACRLHYEPSLKECL